MFTENESQEILERALRAAAADEADAVLISTDRNISRFANSTLHQNMSEESASLSLRVVINGSMGVASITAFDDDEIARAAAVARDAARHSNPLPRFEGLHRSAAALQELPTFDEPTARLTAAGKALALKEMFEEGRREDVHFAGSYSTGATSVACANTHGVRRAASMTAVDATVIAIHSQGSGYSTSCARTAADVDIPALGREATVKARLKGDSIQDFDPGVVDVILEPPALAEVFEWMTMIAFTGQAYEDGSSFLVDNVGKRIVGENFTVADDATDPSFLPFPFDLEGLPKSRVPLIENGVARLPLVDKAYSDRLGIPANGGAWSLGGADHGAPLHLAISGGTSTREELIQSTRLGVWVTRFNYVNGLLEPKSALMTGTTRDGTFLIRDGEVVARLPNLRWTQSMIEALSNVEGLTGERRRVSTWYNMFGGTLAPTMKIRDWHFTGRQQTTGL